MNCMLAANRLRLALVFWGHQILLFFLLRAALFVTYWRSLPHNPAFIAKALLIGFWIDAAVALCVVLPYVIYAAAASNRLFARRAHAIFLGFSYFLILYLLIFLNIADYLFFDEFQARFNYVAVDYLFVTPREVLENIWQSYPVPLVLALVAAASGLLCWSIRKPIKQWSVIAVSGKQRLIFCGAWVLCGSLLLSGLDISRVRFSSYPILNEIGANGFYTFSYALKTNDLVYDQFYKTIDETQAFGRLKNLIVDAGSKSLDNTANPLARHVLPRKGLGSVNVVLILEESLGANFTGVLGRHPMNLTPNFDGLAKEGILLSHIYATGNRTVRALEAVLTSFPPIPGASIVKRHKSQNVITLARVLKMLGYQTLFVYGGRGLFDNMRDFMLSNGFDRFVEQKDFEHPTFTTAWGVCDEDIFHKAIDELEVLHEQRKPFFATILSVSNHKPYTYPKGRIDLDPGQHNRENAVKYADWAIGDFFKLAREKPFFENTVFVMLGDHGARVYGADFIPIKSYEVPVVIYAPSKLQPRLVDTLGCSMDVAPTILGLLGLGYDSIFYGRDLLHLPGEAGYALMQHDRDVGFLRDNRLAVLSTGKFAGVFEFDRAGNSFKKETTLSAQDQDLLLDEVSFYQTAYHLYDRGAYRLVEPN